MIVPISLRIPPVPAAIPAPPGWYAVLRQESNQLRRYPVAFWAPQLVLLDYATGSELEPGEPLSAQAAPGWDLQMQGYIWMDYGKNGGFTPATAFDNFVCYIGPGETLDDVQLDDATLE